jgi:hypothetical protein
VRGLPFVGEHFLGKTEHPSDSSPISQGGMRGIGLEWPTKQIFLVESGSLLFFESVAEVFPNPCVELYVSVRVDAPAPGSVGGPVNFSFNFGAQKFAFDLESHLAERQSEVDMLLRLKQKYALPIIRFFFFVFFFFFFFFFKKKVFFV